MRQTGVRPLKQWTHSVEVEEPAQLQARHETVAARRGRYGPRAVGVPDLSRLSLAPISVSIFLAPPDAEMHGDTTR